MNYKLVSAIWFAAILLGSLCFVGGIALKDSEMRDQFELMTRINWYSFAAAHADCVKHHKMQCKLDGGFAPLSSFKE
jgi:hypothetical protein